MNTYYVQNMRTETGAALTHVVFEAHDDGEAVRTVERLYLRPGQTTRVGRLLHLETIEVPRTPHEED